MIGVVTHTENIWNTPVGVMHGDARKGLHENQRHKKY